MSRTSIVAWVSAIVSAALVAGLKAAPEDVRFTTRPAAMFAAGLSNA